MEVKVFQPSGPDSNEGKSNLTIVRCPGGDRKLRVVILSDNICHTRTHFAGRTQPCTHPNCEHCRAGKESEYHGYVIVGFPKTFKKALCELTAVAARILMDERQEHKTLHGCGIELRRKNGKDTGTVWCEIIRRDCPTLVFGEVPECLPILYTIWRFNPMRKAEADAAERRFSVESGNGEVPQGKPPLLNEAEVSSIKKGSRKRS